MEIFETILLKVNEDIKKWDGELIFIFIPSQSRYSNVTSYLDEFFYDLPIKKFLKKNDIRFLELNNVFKTTNDPNKFYNGHLNILGHITLSDYILEVMFQNY